MSISVPPPAPRRKLLPGRAGSLGKRGWRCVKRIVLRRNVKWRDPKALLALLSSLPQTLEYEGEFGPELVLFLPWLTWLSAVGLLRGRRVRTYRGMRCFYDELDCLEIIEKPDARDYVTPADRLIHMPVRDEHDFDRGGRSPFHIYPDFRRRFGALPMLPDLSGAGRPLLVIHNKYNVEWRDRPRNFIPIETLETIFTTLGPRFTIVYIRHGMSEPHEAFSGDGLEIPEFADQDLLRRFPEVLNFEDLFDRHRAAGGSQDLNTFKSVLYSRCHHFISAQGGGAHQIAFYSGALLSVLHRRGSELSWSYGEGFYDFVSRVPPVRAICRTEAELVASLTLFLDTAFARDRVLVAPTHAELLARLSPENALLRESTGSGAG